MYKAAGWLLLKRVELLMLAWSKNSEMEWMKTVTLLEKRNWEQQSCENEMALLSCGNVHFSEFKAVKQYFGHHVGVEYLLNI